MEIRRDIKLKLTKHKILRQFKNNLNVESYNKRHNLKLNTIDDVINDLNIKSHDIKDYVLSAFYFSSSNEGNDYWWNIWYKI